MSAEQPSRWQRFKCAANPLNPTAGYVAPHVLVLILVALIVYVIGFASGWNTRSRYDAAFFAKRYAFPGLKTPPPGVSAPIRDVHRAGLAAQASIPRSYYPSVGDQGPLGECAAYASAWDMSYELRRAGTFGWLRLSPIFEYSYYSGRYSGGQDAGSWPDQDLELLQSTGLPKFKQVPTPPYQILNPLPTTDATGAALRLVKASYQIHYISGFAQGGGQGVVDAARSAIASGHPVMWALPVYPEYDNATQQPLIVSPTPGEVSRGGHANVFLAYDDTKVFPDGTVGGFLTQNQWTKQWGSSGRAWVSYDFVRRYSFGLEYITLGAQAPHAGPPHRFSPNHAPKHSIVPTGYRPLPTAPSTTAWRVKGVYTQDTHVSLDASINYWGTKYNIWPVGLTAVLATESGIQAVPWCCRPYDISYGIAQFVPATACGYGICSNIQAWLDNPFNSIYLMARFLRDAQNVACVSFPWLYAAYNQGPYLGCNSSAYTNPQGVAALNFQGFLRNYNYVIATYSDYGPAPKPAVFPRSKWGTSVNPYVQGHLRYAARYWWTAKSGFYVKRLGKAKFQRYFPHYVKTFFDGGPAIFCWHNGHCKAAW